MPDIGFPELILILLVVLIVFGAGKLPDIGRGLGQSIREFRRAARDDSGDREQLGARNAAKPGSN